MSAINLRMKYKRNEIEYEKKVVSGVIDTQQSDAVSVIRAYTHPHQISSSTHSINNLQNQTESKSSLSSLVFNGISIPSPTNVQTTALSSTLSRTITNDKILIFLALLQINRWNFSCFCI
jgi:hypothetical protein